MKEQIEFYSQFIGPADLCFDIGANMGDKTDSFLTLGARVVAVEPQKQCADKLRNRFHHNPNCIIVEKALGKKEEEEVMYVNDSSVLSTLSSEWIKSMQESGRFGDNFWRSHIPVSVTTLDRLIEEFGVPTFSKIDVEGYEWNVMQGLSHAIPALSIEFAKEMINNTNHCIQYLETLGNYEFNFCNENNLLMKLDHWVDSVTIRQAIGQLSDKFSWGDVYARLKK
ncbi:FkbM family methyltransferase [Brevibacillus centrosporus]|uniref:FkbM family methyltransferase n=1 Tax=Brevibacillus centrosporus TaxID=54910 RepID=UPI002E1CA68D|nr:FkbM family methyltransferase [Brevibacillus centrosporus]MED4912164.1 FkbM family methyltransferase [Brevibacillus centrosporus]